MNEKPNEVRAEYEVKVRLTGTRTVRVKARSAIDAVEAAQKPIRMDDGTILFCEAESGRRVSEGN